MAIIQLTDLFCTVESRIHPYGSETTIELGPTEYMQADSVLITAEKLKTVGGVVSRVNEDWSANLVIYGMVSGTAAGLDLTDMTTVVMTSWDPISRTTNTYFTYTKDADQSSNPGVGVIAFDSTNGVAGMYQFRIYGTYLTNEFELCSGWIEVRAQYE